MRDTHHKGQHSRGRHFYKRRKMPSARVRRHATDLQLLARAKGAVRKRMLCQASQSLIMALVDVAKALIRGELTMTPRQLNSAKRRKHQLRGLARSNVSVESKRKALTQDGNLLGLLLKPLLSAVAGPLISGILG